jgi:hypothetical protein
VSDKLIPILFAQPVGSSIKALNNFKNIVFSDIRKANLIFGVCLFCIFVRNTIYELLMIVLEPAMMARKHKSRKAPILMLDCMISQVSRGL